MEFKVGDIVRIKSENLIGKIREISVSGVWFDIETMTNKTTKFYDISVGNKNYIVKDYDLELIERAITNEQIKLDQLEKRIEKLEKCIMGEQKELEKSENVSNLEKMTLTKDNIEDLRYWREIGYKWTCKDEKGSIHIFKIKPIVYNIEELLKGDSEE